jgi:hypothetical protein
MGEIQLINNKYSYDPLINDVFYEIDTGGGGDCLFRSLSYSLYGTPKYHFEVRQKVCKAKIPDELKPFYVEEERQQMCREGEWGTNNEVWIAAKLYKRPIIVYLKDHDTGISKLCPGYDKIDKFKGVRKYLFDKKFSSSSVRIYCIYLPDENRKNGVNVVDPRQSENSNIEPILLYNLGQTHYRVLKPKDKIVHFGKKKTVKKSLRKSSRKSKKSKKISRKNKKTVKKSVGKSRKSRKTRKTRKSIRKNRKSRKTRKSIRKSRKTRKTRKSIRKTRKSIRKTRKSIRKTRKTRKSVRKTRKIRKNFRKSRKQY